jgi:protein SCO1/2
MRLPQGASWLVVVSAFCLLSSSELAGEPIHELSSAVPVVDDEAVNHAQCRVPDVQLITADAKPVRFYTDLVKGRTVVISFVFTTCTTICSPVAANIAQLQALLDDRMATDVNLVSVSIDPVTDTPSRLNIWAMMFEPEPGWSFVTGDKVFVDRLLKDLAVFTPTIEDHAPILVVMNDRTGACAYANALAAPEELADLVGRIDQGESTP